MGQLRIPAVFMRGGTSKAIMFHSRDLPADLVVIVGRDGADLCDFIVGRDFLGPPADLRDDGVDRLIDAAL